MDISGRSWDVHLRSSSWAKSNRCQQSGRRERQVDTDRRGGSHVTPETGTVMNWPLIQKCSQSPETGRGKERTQPKSLSMSTDQLTSDFRHLASMPNLIWTFIGTESYNVFVFQVQPSKQHTNVFQVLTTQCRFIGQHSLPHMCTFKLSMPGVTLNSIIAWACLQENTSQGG